jgi:hypothetical protein
MRVCIVGRDVERELGTGLRVERHAVRGEYQRSVEPLRPDLRYEFKMYGLGKIFEKEIK